METQEIAAKLREHYHKLCRKEAATRQTYDDVFNGGNDEGEDEKRATWMAAHANRDEFFSLIVNLGLYNEVFPSDDDG